VKKLLFSLVLIFAILIPFRSNALAASGSSYPWRDHAAPYTYLFGNHIDSHQQSETIDGGQIQGYLYIHYTGQTINGIPVAEHTDCSMDPTSCIVGWQIQGVSARATAVSMDSMGMAQFCASAFTLRSLNGYSHFHWIGDPMMDMDIQIGQAYTGYLLKLTARTTFYFNHHDSMVLVTPGVDTVSHANVTSCN
jgi:hypothetical protein